MDSARPSDTPKPKLLDQVRQTIRTRHYSYMTEKAYVGWIKRFIFFHNKRHPAEMAEAEIAPFLSSLATDRRVSASTQNQALNALRWRDSKQAFSNRLVSTRYVILSRLTFWKMAMTFGPFKNC